MFFCIILYYLILLYIQFTICSKNIYFKSIIKSLNLFFYLLIAILLKFPFLQEEHLAYNRPTCSIHKFPMGYHTGISCWNKPLFRDLVDRWYHVFPKMQSLNLLKGTNTMYFSFFVTFLRYTKNNNEFFIS